MPEPGPAAHRLTTAQLEQRLAAGGLPPTEQQELSVELSRRMADELLEGMPGPRPPVPGWGGPASSAPVSPAPTGRAASPRPPTMPVSRPPAGPDEPARPAGGRSGGGFARFLGGALALAVVAGGGLAVVGALSDYGGSSGTYTPEYSTSTSYETESVPGSQSRTPSVRTPSVPRTGISGTVQVSWSPAGQTCVATVGTVGVSGQADVSCRLDTGEVLRVRQALALTVNGDTAAYVGSDPQDLTTGALLRAGVDYFPEIFVLGADDAGQYVVVQVCDTRGPETCAPAG